MKKLLLLALCAVMYGDDLKSLIEFAQSNNHIIKSKLLTQTSKQKDMQSVKNSYYPTVDVGGFYQNTNRRTPMQPGDVYSGYAKVGVDLYDGGRKDNIIKQKNALFESSKYDISAYKKSLQLEIVKIFFDIQSAKESLKALNEKNARLIAEVKRIKKFYEVGSATKDDVDKLQAALSNNVYQIESIKFQIHSFKQILSLKVGKNISTISPAHIRKPINLQKKLDDNIEALKQNAKALEFGARSINSAYKPQIKLEDTFNLYSYGRSDATHPKGLNNQNKLMLNFNIIIFDNNVFAKQKESVLLQKMALEQQIKQQEKAQDINAKLARSKIYTIKAQIKSAKSSLISANSAYENISKKFKAGTVDNVAYLDALSVKTNAKAQYETALNDLQVAYASYYFYSNENIKDYMK